MLSINPSLLNIPSEVLQDNLFPFLSVNELLRLRRTCKWGQALSEDHFRLHSPPTRVTLNLDEDEGSSSMKLFLLENRNNPILPSKFKLVWNHKQTLEIFQDPLISEFAEKYGDHVVELDAQGMTLPFEDFQFEFYANLPNLNKLKVGHATIDFNSLKEDEDDQLNLPETFRNIKHLKILIPGQAQPHIVWKVVNFCRSLEHFSTSYDPELQVLYRILKKGYHDHLKVFDMKENGVYSDNKHIDKICKWSVKYDIKWANVPYLLLVNMEHSQRTQIAPQILSIQGKPTFANMKGVVFPNVESIRISWLNFWPPSTAQQQQERQHDVSEKMSAELFPSLRKLGFYQCRMLPDDVEIVFQTLWKKLTNLEELKFTNSTVTDGLFLGVDGEHSFLTHLIKLKKLTLGDIYINPLLTTSFLTDASFHEIFRNMKLREFRLDSSKPQPHITRNGIHALLSGPFMQAIRKFPFRGWSLEDLTQEEFQQLAGEFGDSLSV